MAAIVYQQPALAAGAGWKLGADVGPGDALRGAFAVRVVRRTGRDRQANASRCLGYARRLAGTQTPTWKPDIGDWTHVAMNADGSRQFAVRLSVAATAISPPRIAAGLLIAEPSAFNT